MGTKAHFGEASLENDPNGEFHRQTTGVWQQRTSSPLSRETIREITKNITGFFEMLSKWDETDRRALESSDTRGQTKAVSQR